MTDVAHSGYPLSVDQWRALFRWPRWRLERGMRREPLKREFRSAGTGDTVRLLFCGDVMVKSHDHVPVLHDGIVSVLGSADHLFGTLEAPVSFDKSDPDIKYPSGGKMPPFKMPLEFLQTLFKQTNLPFNKICLSVAANHAADQGAAGFETTREIIATCGINVVGEFDQRRAPITMLQVGRLKVGIVAWTQWMNGDPFDFDHPGVMREHHLPAFSWKEIARDNDIDFLIAMPHWDLEMSVTPSRANMALAKWLIREGGFSVICGSHPHIIQPIELIDEGLCHYSLSNFTYTLSNLCTGGNSWMTCLSTLTEITVDQDTGDINGYQIHPFVERSTSDGSEIILLSDYVGEYKSRYESLLAGVFDLG